MQSSEDLIVGEQGEERWSVQGGDLPGGQATGGGHCSAGAEPDHELHRVFPPGAGWKLGAVLVHLLPDHRHRHLYAPPSPLLESLLVIW